MSRWLWTVPLAGAAIIAAAFLLGHPSRPDQPLKPDGARPAATNPTTIPVTGGSAKVLARTPADSMPGPDRTSTAATIPATPSRPGAITPAAAPTPADFIDPPPELVMQNMRDSFRNYQSMFGSNPVGTNPEITRALTGDNPRKAAFIQADDGLRVNGKGELIDSWGTPFFFHQLSGTEMETHSAGPDRVMWTADDLVVK